MFLLIVLRPPHRYDFHFHVSPPPPLPPDIAFWIVSTLCCLAFMVTVQLTVSEPFLPPQSMLLNHLWDACHHVMRRWALFRPDHFGSRPCQRGGWRKVWRQRITTAPSPMPAWLPVRSTEAVGVGKRGVADSVDLPKLCLRAWLRRLVLWWDRALFFGAMQSAVAVSS